MGIQTQAYCILYVLFVTLVAAQVFFWGWLACSIDFYFCTAWTWMPDSFVSLNSLNFTVDVFVSFWMLLVVALEKFVETLGLYGKYSNFWWCVRLCIRISGTLFACFGIAYLSASFLLMLCASCFHQSISSSL